jgi:hypothetical protein
MAGLRAGLFLSVPTTPNNTMRKIEAQMVLAVRNALNGSERTWRTGNTEVTTEHVGIHGTPSYERYVVVRLHDNEIARFDSSLNYAAGCKGLGLNDAGWRTTTTKSRINALLACFTDDCVVYQKAGQWLITTTWAVGNPWLGKDWVSYGWQDNHNCRRAAATV